MITKHSLLRSVTPLAIFALVVAACSSPAASTAPSTAASQPAETAAGSAPAGSAPAASAADLTALIAAAKTEGTVSVIALPHDQLRAVLKKYNRLNQ